MQARKHGKEAATKARKAGEHANSVSAKLQQSIHLNEGFIHHPSMLPCITYSSSTACLPARWYACLHVSYT
jgi:hypothetical protein